MESTDEDFGTSQLTHFQRKHSIEFQNACHAVPQQFLLQQCLSSSSLKQRTSSLSAVPSLKQRTSSLSSRGFNQERSDYKPTSEYKPTSDEMAGFNQWLSKTSERYGKKMKKDTSQGFMQLLNSGSIDGSFTGSFLYFSTIP